MSRVTVREQIEGVGGEVVSHKHTANNTTECCMKDGSVVLRLHHTNILTLRADDCLVLNSGGWRTKITKERLQEALRKKSQWRLDSERGVWIVRGFGKSWGFQDGMVLHPDGKVEGAGKAEYYEKQRARVREYAKGYMEALEGGKIGAPGNGDCWGCLMVDEKTGKTAMGSDHLLDHMKERYYVPSLLMNVFKQMNAGVVWKNDAAMLMKMTGWEKGSYCFNHPDLSFRKQVGRWIARYMYRELGI